MANLHTVIGEHGVGNLPVPTDAALTGNYPDPALPFGFSQLNRRGPFLA